MFDEEDEHQEQQQIGKEKRSGRFQHDDDDSGEDANLCLLTPPPPTQSQQYRPSQSQQQLPSHAVYSTYPDLLMMQQPPTTTTTMNQPQSYSHSNSQWYDQKNSHEVRTEDDSLFGDMMQSSQPYQQQHQPAMPDFFSQLHHDEPSSSSHHTTSSALAAPFQHTDENYDEDGDEHEEEEEVASSQHWSGEEEDADHADDASYREASTAPPSALSSHQSSPAMFAIESAAHAAASIPALLGGITPSIQNFVTSARPLLEYGVAAMGDAAAAAEIGRRSGVALDYTVAAMDTASSLTRRGGTIVMDELIPVLVSVASATAVASAETIAIGVPKVGQALSTAQAHISESTLPACVQHAKSVQRWLAARVHLTPQTAVSIAHAPARSSGHPAGAKEELSGYIEYIEHALKQQEQEENVQDANTPEGGAVTHYLSGQSVVVVDNHFSHLTQREKAKLEEFLVELKKVRAATTALSSSLSTPSPAFSSASSSALPTPSNHVLTLTEVTDSKLPQLHQRQPSRQTAIVQHEEEERKLMTQRSPMIRPSPPATAHLHPRSHSQSLMPNPSFDQSTLAAPTSSSSDFAPSGPFLQPSSPSPQALFPIDSSQLHQSPHLHSHQQQQQSQRQPLVIDLLSSPISHQHQSNQHQHAPPVVQISPHHRVMHAQQQHIMHHQHKHSSSSTSYPHPLPASQAQDASFQLPDFFDQHIQLSARSSPISSTPSPQLSHSRASSSAPPPPDEAGDRDEYEDESLRFFDQQQQQLQQYQTQRQQSQEQQSEEDEEEEEQGDEDHETYTQQHPQHEQQQHQSEAHIQAEQFADSDSEEEEDEDESQQQQDDEEAQQQLYEESVEQPAAEEIEEKLEPEVARSDSPQPEFAPFDLSPAAPTFQPSSHHDASFDNFDFFSAPSSHHDHKRGFDLPASSSVTMPDSPPHSTMMDSEPSSPSFGGSDSPPSSFATASAAFRATSSLPTRSTLSTRAPVFQPQQQQMEYSEPSSRQRPPSQQSMQQQRHYANDNFLPSIPSSSSASLSSPPQSSTSAPAPVMRRRMRGGRTE